MLKRASASSAPCSIAYIFLAPFSLFLFPLTVFVSCFVNDNDNIASFLRTDNCEGLPLPFRYYFAIACYFHLDRREEANHTVWHSL